MRGPDLTEKNLVRMMVGRSLDDIDVAAVDAGEPMLRVAALTRRGVFHDVNLVVRRREIVGMAGMVGSGRTEVARAIIGADKSDGGSIEVSGRRLKLRSPADAIRAGIAFLTEDRKQQGLVLHMSVASNATLAKLKTRFGLINRRSQRNTAQEILARIHAPIPVSRLASELSGGTQQKVVLAKWLLTKSDIFIFDEPTRGIDVGAKAEIYQLMRGLANAGAAILMISSELPELLLMSDRVLVMRAGSIVAEMPRAEATEERIVALASGGEEWIP